MMAELKVVYERVRKFAGDADRFAGVLDEGLGTADGVAAVVDGVLIGLGAVASPAAAAAVGAANTYYFTEVRPTASHTRDFLRELADYFRQVATNLEEADSNAAGFIEKVKDAVGPMPPLPI
jgi:hypothetical protein